MWTSNNIPDQSGKTFLITGANTGIGFETALALYKSGANVTITGRDAASIELSMHKILAATGSGTVYTALLDLSSPNSIEAFASHFLSTHVKLDVLINNAGVMTPPESKTEEGYEMQFGVNFLGHFVLTGYLFPLLKVTGGARIVTLSSGAHKYVDQVNYQNLRIEQGYDANREYAISKLANLQFTLELQKRIDKAGLNILSIGAHPGVTKTGLARHMPEAAYQAALKQFGDLMPAWQGALPSLYAATSSGAMGGGYYGPDGENELKGYPASAHISESAGDEVMGAGLWNFAEKATGIVYPY
jgi:NAD(P)-dependent dehydrogenase (short-subunit alcohol dehydrogenase family)